MSGSNLDAFPQTALEATKQSAAQPYLRVTAGGHNLFADTIIDENAIDRGKRAASAGLALTIQAAVVVVGALVPLLFTEGIDPLKLNNMLLLTAPSPPTAPPPPAMHVQSIAKRSVLHAALTAPTVIPRKVVVSAPNEGMPAPTISDLAGGVPGGGDVLGGSLTNAPPPPPPAPAAKPKELRIFTGMKEPALLYAPPLVYPPVARQAHVQGTVVIEAIIDEKGNVTQVKAISGPGLLTSAALKAVSARKYQPTILDGQPVSIRFDVKVEFKLS